ncbi:AMP-binding protein [Micromonospora sp. STR1_7]|uniref:AMP-binding protein n=1 Tax=Micromonospora parastrephiae TaxID=2806101 RepID=A0ABS1XWC1_9ACTN|nr:AMP-binding protein [Micromonospora parastrephiae]MBM0233571.1 AMP-binding protein [Micromonospora parastrephiae]
MPYQSAISIPQAMRSAAAYGGSLTFLDARLRPTRHTLDGLNALAEGLAGGLAKAGVAPGDRVGVLAPTSDRMIATLFALWRLGAAVAVLPRPRHADGDTIRREVADRLAAIGAAALLTDTATAAELDGRLPLTVQAIDAIPNAPTAAPPPPAPEQLGLLQFTSGTTGRSKVVPVRQTQLVGNVARCAVALGMRPGDTYVSWLPFYHDMGIVSVVGLLCQGLDVIVLEPETFLRRPAAWMEVVSRYRATITAGPNTAYRLAARAQQLRPAELDLSALRVAINGAEPVTVDVVEETLKTLAAVGMRPEALCPTYGMAETTLVVSTGDPRRTVPVLDPASLAVGAGLDRPVRPVVSCGRPLPDTEVAIRDLDGRALPDGAVGEVFVRGPGVVDGYWSLPGNPRDVPDGGVQFVDGWLRTGDLGFLRDGELYVCGRIKDMIIIGGRNLYPEDYENAAERVNGVRAGNVIAFALTEQERMVVVAEGLGREESLAGLAQELFDRLRTDTQYAPHEVVLVRAGTLPKTSSGKRQRRRCREQYLAGELRVVCTVS